jgi:hypothetical protein
MDWKSMRNYKKSLKAKNIYAIVRYADWCVREYKFAGKLVWDKLANDYIPLVYHYNDHNGEYESYDVVKLTHTTAGFIVGWTFAKNRAESWAYSQKILEKVNYGKSIEN